MIIKILDDIKAKNKVKLSDVYEIIQKTRIAKIRLEVDKNGEVFIGELELLDINQSGDADAN